MTDERLRLILRWTLAALIVAALIAQRLSPSFAALLREWMNTSR